MGGVNPIQNNFGLLEFFIPTKPLNGYYVIYTMAGKLVYN